MENTDPQAEISANKTAGLTFAALGQPLQSPSDIDLQAQSNPDAHWTARKACATLKVTSSIMNAIVVHPGADCDDDTLSKTTRDLMQRAKVLAQCAVDVLKVRSDTRNYAAYMTMLRLQAAEVVSTQWRMAHVAGKKPLTEGQIARLYETLVDTEMFAELGDPASVPEDLSLTTIQRLALLSTTPEIHQAVNSFDYFAPQPEQLIHKAVDQIKQATDEGMQKLLGSAASDATRAVIAQSLIEKNGSLYAANYRAVARRDVMALQEMQADERARHLYVHRQTGLPTDHINSGFRRIASRMIDMVCEAVPELAMNAPASAPAVERSAVRESFQQPE